MTNRTEKEDSRWARYRSGITMMGRKMEAYAKGECLGDEVANEIVAIFRAHGCCLDKSGVSYDGSMAVLIAAALKAAEKYGARTISVIESEQV